MTKRHSPLPFAKTTRIIVLVALSTGLLSAAEEPRRISWTFEADNPGAAADGWRTERGEWKVVVDRTAPTLYHAFAQSARSGRSTFNLALAPQERFGDIDLTVRLRAVSGEVDRGGGPVWRAKDRDNYYVCRYNPLERNFRVYFVALGRRKQLASADAKPKDGWNEIRVTMTGDHIRCYLDGKLLLDVRDRTFPLPGMIGLWTKADAVTHFDDVRLVLAATSE